MLLDNNRANPSQIKPSEITPQSIFEQRRTVIKALGLGAAATALSSTALFAQAATKPQRLAHLKTKYGQSETLTSFQDVTTYNNYYEFGTDKSDPAREAVLFKPNPWAIQIEGAVKTPKTISLEQLLKLSPLEERIYRMRCVEGWSMVIPWVGLPLKKLIDWAEPTGNAKYIAFISANDTLTMPGARMPILDWPYVEGLRMDEAAHPLTLLAVGLYGQVLPNQNGAPVRLVVPWKYGFKGGKAITKIQFLEKMPQTTWMKAGPSEYGFYANVNPHVDHPRWTQSSERRIGAGLFAGRVKTKMFNGYDEVGQLYAGMDLAKHF